MSVNAVNVPNGKRKITIEINNKQQKGVHVTQVRLSPIYNRQLQFTLRRITMNEDDREFLNKRFEGLSKKMHTLMNVHEAKFNVHVNVNKQDHDRLERKVDLLLNHYGIKDTE